MTASTTRPPLRIGGASGFWGDSSLGAPQLVNSGLIDVLVFDYLAETTMAILAAAQRKNPEAGFATDFVDPVMRQVLPEVVKRGIKVITNAGGIHPQACARALAKVADELGLSVKIAIVEGDDVRTALPALREAAPGGKLTDLVGGKPVPANLLSANAYLGAEPIARALDAGAQIVITGRSVDSAVTLGALIHHFGWSMSDFDRLAGASLAGHIIECGCQATGGLFTDWDTVPDWAHIGYPIVECAEDGSFTVAKVPGTGGLISPATVGEQLLYEIGDPGAYLLPDVACDFRQVTMVQAGENRVHVAGAKGSAPPPTLKVSATHLVGWRCDGMTVIVGIDAVAKARRTGESLVERVREMVLARGWGDFSAVRVEVIGTETLYGPHTNAALRGAREVMVRVALRHPKKEALELYSRERAAPGTSWSPGTTGPGGGRASVSPHIVPCAFLIPREAVQPVVRLGDQTIAVPMAATARPVQAAAPVAEPAGWTPPAGATKTVPLVRLAWGRSGDKGDISNIGLIARRPEWLPLLWAQVTAERVAAWFPHMVKGRIDRYHLPGLHAMNLVMQQALDGGGPASLRLDPLGKGMAQMLLELPITVPADWDLPPLVGPYRSA